MNITVTGRNIDVTPSLRQYAEEKIGKFERFLSHITEAVVTLSVQKYRHRAEVLIKANGVMLQAVGETEELYSSIDEVADKLDKQVKKLKNRQKTRRKADARTGKAESQEPAEEPAFPEAGIIIEKKRFAMKPMPPEEAAMQLDIMGERKFFVFTNSESGSINVIYRQSDGNLGLIEPV